MGKGKEITIGYRYFFGIHMGLCRGPIDELVEIKVADRTAWSGSITSSTNAGINAPDLFGGEKGEGGIAGQLSVLMGEPTQAVHAGLAAMLGGLVPAFRGVSTLFFDGQVCALNPYPKPWKMRIRRAVQGWDGAAWNPADAVVSLASGAIRAMNPAHIIYEALTNRDWGRGIAAARLDDVSFQAAADTFLAEGLGLCLRWTRSDEVQNFIASVLDHCGAAVYPDRHTGLLKLVPVRDNYNPATLPLYTYDNGLLGIDDDDNGAQSAAVNEVIVKYVRPQDGSEGQVRAQNIASIHALGKISTTTDYPGLPTAELAARTAQRDLRAGSGFIKRFKLRFDRRFLEAPVSLFRISDPYRGITNMVLRVGRMDRAGPTDGTITVTALQDVFGLPATSYVGNQVSGWVAPDHTPAVIAARRLIEVPYRELVRRLDPANLEALDPTSGALGTLAVRPTPLSRNCSILTRVGISGAFTERGVGPFCPTGTLSAGISRTEVAATIANGVGLSSVIPGGAALVDNEILRIDTIDAGTGAITFARACADTIPALHSGGARVWFFESHLGVDPTEYISGSSVYARLLTNTSAGQLAEGSAGTDSLVMVQRHFRPYPPGNLLVNGASYPASISAQLALTWAHRDRVTQADQLIGTDEASIGPEVGVTYTVRIYGDGVLQRTVSGIAGTGYTYALEQELADGGPFDPVRFTVNASRSGLESLQGHDWEVAHPAPPGAPATVLPYSFANGNWYGRVSTTGVPASSADASTWTALASGAETVAQLIFGSDGRFHGVRGVQLGRSDSASFTGTWTYVTVAGFTSVSWDALRVVGSTYYAWSRNFHTTSMFFDYPIIVQSADNGASWSAVGANNLPKAFTLVDLHWIAADSRWLAFGTFNEEVSPSVFERRPRVYASADLLTWSLLATLSPTPATDDYVLNCTVRNGDVLLAGMSNLNGVLIGALARSIDRGATWSFPAVSWPDTSPAPLGIISAAFDGTRYLVAGRDWVGRSTDGASWTLATALLGATEGFAPLLSNGAGTTVAGLSTATSSDNARSTDGATWTRGSPAT